MIYRTGEDQPAINVTEGKVIFLQSLSWHMSQALNTRGLKSSMPAATISWHLSQIRSEDRRSKMQLSPRGLQQSGQGCKVGTNPWCTVRSTDKCQDWAYTCQEHHVHEHTNLLSFFKKINHLKLKPCFVCLVRGVWYKYNCTREKHIWQWIITGPSTKHILMALIRSLYIFSRCLYQSTCSRSPPEAKGVIQNNMPKLET